jgi:hypothetical protein
MRQGWDKPEIGFPGPKNSPALKCDALLYVWNGVHNAARHTPVHATAAFCLFGLRQAASLCRRAERIFPRQGYFRW